MKKFASHALSCLALLSFVACASSGPMPRKPSSVEPALQKLEKLLPEGTYEGRVPGENASCRIQANYKMQVFISGTRSDFDFTRGDRSSQACMYSQACFKYTAFQTEVTDSSFGRSGVTVEIELDKDGESSGKFKMWATVEKEDDHTTVTIKEKVGLLHMLTSTVVCEIPN